MTHSAFTRRQRRNRMMRNYAIFALIVGLCFTFWAGIALAIRGLVQ